MQSFVSVAWGGIALRAQYPAAMLDLLMKVLPAMFWTRPGLQIILLYYVLFTRLYRYQFLYRIVLAEL